MKTRRQGRRLLAALAAWLMWLGCGDVPQAAADQAKDAAAAAASAVPVSPGGAAESPEPSPAQRASIPTTDLLGILHDAGWPMYAIALCSFALVTFSLERIVSLSRRRVIPAPFVTRFQQQLRDGQLGREQALELCNENDSPVARVFAGAVRKWGRAGVEVEQGAIDAGERATNDLRRYLRVFYAVATVGPLLGLMGTVLGMIQTFNVIADPAAGALGHAQLLAGGIAKALLNTAGGLAVAIPASLLYVFFASRADRLVIEIDRLAQEVVNVISAEEIQERKSPSAKSRQTKAA